MPFMQGLDIKGIKKHPSLIPLYLCAFWGVGFGTFCLTRAALKSPDVTWSQKRNPEPWQEYANKDYKLFNPAKTREFKTLQRLHSIWD